MDILFTETVWVSPPVLCIAFLILLIGASIYLGQCSEELPFVMACITIMISAAVLVANFIAGGLYEKEYVYPENLPSHWHYTEEEE